MSLVTALFFLVLLLNQRWSPSPGLQASHFSTFRIMCDVPSIAVFCSESIECFPGTPSKFFLKLLVTIPVAPIIGIIVHFRFDIRCTSIRSPPPFNPSITSYECTLNLSQFFWDKTFLFFVFYALREWVCEILMYQLQQSERHLITNYLSFLFHLLSAFFTS